MRIDAIDRMWKAMDGKVRDWQEQRNHYRLERMNREREELIEILQKRYGYTEEKAKSELHKQYSKVKYY